MPLFSIFRTQPVGPCAVTAAVTASSLSPKQEEFGQALLDRPSGHSEKPMDFADLQKLHKAWKQDGARLGDPRAGQIHDRAQRYLDWAERQRTSRKLNDHRRRAAGMVAETMDAAVAASAATRTPMRARALPDAPVRSTSVSSSGSEKSSASLPSPLAHIKNAVVTGAKQFGAALSAPRAGSFDELQQAFEGLGASIEENRPLDNGEASRVIALARAYLANHSDAATSETQHLRKKLATDYIRLLENGIKRDQLIDTEKQRQARFSPDLGRRTDARQTHLQALVSQFPDLNRTSGGTSDRLIRGDDGNTVYRFMPLPTRQANAGKDLGPQHAVLASVLHRKLAEQTGLDLRFPCATDATLEGVPGVLIDEVNLPSPDAGRVPTVKERQRAALAQWVLGRPSATWRDIGIDALGQTFPRELPQGAPDLLAMATAALGEGPPLPGLQDPVTDGPVRGTDEVLDEDLAKRLRRVDIKALAGSLAVARAAVDVRNALGGVRTGQPAQHFAALHGDAVERLLEPLGALQRAQDIDPDVPLTTLLRNAADELLYRHAPHADTRSPVTPVTRAEPRGLAERVKRGLLKLWNRLRPWKSTSDGRHPDRTAVAARASAPAGTPLAR